MQIWYDRQGQPIDANRANVLLGDRAYQRVALTRIASASDPTVDYRVSTVWLGVNYNFAGDGPPVIFETMSFGGGEDQDQAQWRWSTEEGARAGHAEVVATIAATVPDERVEDLNDWPKEGEAVQAEATVGPHLHRWGQWQDGTATYDSPLFPKLGAWEGPVQTRRCAKCGKTEVRKVG